MRGSKDILDSLPGLGRNADNYPRGESDQDNVPLCSPDRAARLTPPCLTSLPLVLRINPGSKEDLRDNRKFSVPETEDEDKEGRGGTEET